MLVKAPDDRLQVCANYIHHRPREGPDGPGQKQQEKSTNWHIKTNEATDCHQTMSTSCRIRPKGKRQGELMELVIVLPKNKRRCSFAKTVAYFYGAEAASS